MVQSSNQPAKLMVPPGGTVTLPLPAFTVPPVPLIVALEPLAAFTVSLPSRTVTVCPWTDS